MSNLIPFQFDTAQVRVIQDENGEPWFVAKDVAAALGYANPSNAVQAHCKAKRNEVIPDSGMTAIIPERDVYRLIMRSKLPAAEQFEEWVVGEVLPSIRKHSGYMTPEKVEEALLNPDTIIRLATDNLGGALPAKYGNLLIGFGISLSALSDRLQQIMNDPERHVVYSP